MREAPISTMPHPDDFLDDNWAYWHAMDQYYSDTGGGGGGYGGGLDYSAENGMSSDFSSIGGPSIGGGSGGGISVDIGGLFNDIFGSGSGPDPKQQLTAIANSAEAALKKNLGQWQSGLLTADNAKLTGWAILDGMVQNMIQFGAQGIKSAAERDRRIDQSQLRWDWIAYYIDPITGSSVSNQPLPTNVSNATGSNGGGAITNNPNPYTMQQPFTIPGWVVLIAGGLIVWKLSKRG